MADTPTGLIAPGAPIRARDILAIKRTSDQAADVEGGHGVNFTRGPGGITGVLAPPALNLKTYTILYAKNEGAATIQPQEYAVITGSIYDNLNHPFQTGRSPSLTVRRATSADDDDLHWGVAVDAIPVGQLARLFVHGVGMAKIVGVVGTDEDNAQLVNDYDSSDRYLRIMASGEAQVLWHDTVNFALDAAHPATIRVPSGGGGAGTGLYKVANYAALPSAVTVGDGALGYTEDTDYFYGVRAGVWRILHTFASGTSGVVAGDLRYDGTILWFYSAGQWNRLSVFGTP